MIGFGTDTVKEIPIEVIDTKKYRDLYKKMQMDIENCLLHPKTSGKKTIVSCEGNNKTYSLKEICEFFGVREDVMQQLFDKKELHEVELGKKPFLTLEESAKYFNIGIAKIRKLTDDEKYDFVLFNGSKRLIKREELEKYLNKAYSI